MTREDYDRLERLYPHYTHQNCRILPDAWTPLIEALFGALQEIQPPVEGVIASPLFVWIIRSKGFGIAFVSPNPEVGEWTAEKAEELVHVLQAFNYATGCIGIEESTYAH